MQGLDCVFIVRGGVRYGIDDKDLDQMHQLYISWMKRINDYKGTRLQLAKIIVQWWMKLCNFV